MTEFERRWAADVSTEIAGYMRKRILDTDDRESIIRLAKSVGMHPIALKDIEEYMTKKILSADDRESIRRVFRDAEEDVKNDRQWRGE